MHRRRSYHVFAAASASIFSRTRGDTDSCFWSCRKPAVGSAAQRLVIQSVACITSVLVTVRNDEAHPCLAALLRLMVQRVKAVRPHDHYATCTIWKHLTTHGCDRSEQIGGASSGSCM